MTQITLDNVLASQLHKISQVVQLCDPAGHVLGRFVPTMEMSEWEPLSPEVSSEELDRREESTRWHSTTDVLSYLEKLGQ